MSRRHCDTVIEIDVRDYLDLSAFDGPLEQSDERELKRLIGLAGEAARALGKSPLSLAIRDCVERLEPMRRRLEEATK